MLESIDQWAFHFLFALYGLLGIQDIPREPSPDWTVIERWAEQSDKTYRLVLESASIPTVCSSVEEYVVFPQTFMAQYSIFADNQLVESNSLDNKWHLATLFDRPTINCQKLVGAKKIRYEVYSYQQFFNAITHYPVIRKGFPRDNFLYNAIYLISATVCICLGIVGAIIISKLRSSENTFYFIIKDLILASYIICYASGYVFSFSIVTLHTLVGLALTTSFLLVIKPIFFDGKIGTRVLVAILLVNSFIWFINISMKNTTEFLMIIYNVPFFLCLAVANIVTFFIKKDKFNNVEKFTYLLIFILASQDINVAYYERHGFFHVSFLIMVMSIVNFLKVIKEVQLRSVEIGEVKQRLFQENNMVTKLTVLHEKYRETIHDLKSPISAFNFLAKGNIGGEALSRLSERFSEILRKIEGNGLNLTVDWYVPELLERCIEDVSSEKALSGSRVIVERKIDEERIEVFFDPVELKVVVSELIDNSIKACKSNLLVKICCWIDQEKLFVSVQDNGPGVPLEILSNLGKKGFTTNGSGLGLFSVKKKVESFGGTVSFKNLKEGFRCEFSFLTRPGRSA